MKRQEIVSFFEHIIRRQEILDPPDVFRFKTVKITRKGTQTLKDIADNSDEGQSGHGNACARRAYEDTGGADENNGGANEDSGADEAIGADEDSGADEDTDEDNGGADTLSQCSQYSQITPTPTPMLEANTETKEKSDGRQSRWKSWCRSGYRRYRCQHNAPSSTSTPMPQAKKEHKVEYSPGW